MKPKILPKKLELTLNPNEKSETFILKKIEKVNIRVYDKKQRIKFVLNGYNEKKEPFIKSALTIYNIDNILETKDFESISFVNDFNNQNDCSFIVTIINNI
jgi:hypothetical protein